MWQNTYRSIQEAQLRQRGHYFLPFNYRYTHQKIWIVDVCPSVHLSYVLFLLTCSEWKVVETSNSIKLFPVENVTGSTFFGAKFSTIRGHTYSQTEISRWPTSQSSTRGRVVHILADISPPQISLVLILLMFDGHNFSCSYARQLHHSSFFYPALQNPTVRLTTSSVGVIHRELGKYALFDWNRVFSEAVRERPRSLLEIHVYTCSILSYSMSLSDSGTRGFLFYFRLCRCD